MNTSTSKILIPIFILAFLAGCGPTVDTAKTANVDLDNYNTFAWLPSKQEISNKNYNTDLVYSTIVDEVNSEMKNQGYNIDKQSPDLLIKVNTMFDRETDRVTEPVYGSYTYTYPYSTVDTFYEPYYYTSYNTVPRVVGYDVDQITYTEGTFIVDIIDAETNEVVWRGWANETIQPDNLRGEISSYVNQIFEEYPS